MAAYGRAQTTQDLMQPVTPRNGFPVRNQGGMPQTPMTTPPRPFVAGPTVAAGPPGPTPNTGGINVQMPTMPAGPFNAPGGAITSAPAPAPAAAPAPAPASAGPASTSTSSTTSSSGQTPVVTPQAGGWNLESQLQNYLGNAFNGSVSPDFVNRAKGDVFRTVQGQTKQATNQINEDAVRRGLYRSGIPAESIANVQGQAQGAMARGVSDILNNAENQNIQGRQAAAGTATNLLGMNREQAKYEQDRADAAAARAAAGQPQTFQYQDPDTGQVYTLDQSWF